MLKTSPCTHHRRTICHASCLAWILFFLLLPSAADANLDYLPVTGRHRVVSAEVQKTGNIGFLVSEALMHSKDYADSLPDLYLHSQNIAFSYGFSPYFEAANWVEREINELLGISFTGHPDMRKLLLPDDWPEGVYPLRADYEEWDKTAIRDRGI